MAKKKIPGYSKHIDVSRAAAQTLHISLDLGMTEALLKRNPDHVDALRLRGDALTRAGRHAEALEVDRRIVRLAPADPLSYYNLACSFSQLNMPDEAIASLERSVRLGCRDARRIQADPDLRNLHDDPRYRRILRRLTRRPV